MGQVNLTFHLGQTPQIVSRVSFPCNFKQCFIDMPSETLPDMDKRTRYIYAITVACNCDTAAVKRRGEGPIAIKLILENTNGGADTGTRGSDTNKEHKINQKRLKKSKQKNESKRCRNKRNRFTRPAVKTTIDQQRLKHKCIHKITRDR